MVKGRGMDIVGQPALKQALHLSGCLGKRPLAKICARRQNSSQACAQFGRVTKTIKTLLVGSKFETLTLAGLVVLDIPRTAMRETKRFAVVEGLAPNARTEGLKFLTCQLRVNVPRQGPTMI